MTSPNPQHDFALVIIGGLVADVSPINLPVGAAAICTDMDFTVGSTFSRDGVQNVYTYEGSDEENNAGLGINIAVTDGVSWVNPDNIIHDTEGTYASLALNQAAPITPGISEFESFVAANGAATGPITISGSAENSYCIFIDAALTGTTIPPMEAGWTGIVNVDGFNVSGIDVNGPITATVAATGYANAWCAVLVFFTGGLTPAPVQHISPAGFTGPTHTASFPGNQTAGNINLAILQGVANEPSPTPTVTDSNGNVYTLIATAQGGTTPNFSYIQVFATGPIVGGANTVTFHITSSSFSANEATVIEMPGATFGGVAPISDILQANTYGFSIPPTSTVLGIEIQIDGLQSLSSTELSIIPISGGTATAFTLPAAYGTTSIGGIGQFFGLTGLTPAIVNNPGFGFQITASDESGNAANVDIAGVRVIVWYTPPGVENFDWVSSFQMEDGSLFTLALDNTGVLWQEDVINDPFVLTPFYTEVEPDTFAQGITYDDREFMAFSDRMNATDIPRQYNGQWVDRVSQVAPGAPPACAATSTNYDVVSITQPAAVASGGTGGPGISALLWSAGVGNKSTAGNVITIYYGTPGTTAPATAADPNIIVGDAVYLAGWADIPSGASPNGTYIITSVGTAAGFAGRIYNVFTVTAPTTALADIDGIDNPPPEGTYNATLATLTTATPIPNVQVGSQISLAGVSPSTWNATWTVLFTPNAAQLQITATSLSANVATYDFTLISGTAPTVGQQVTIVGTDNGDGIFNVSNAMISAVSPGSFSIPLQNANVSPAAESDAQAIINGTIFQFDPGLNDVGTATDPILGTGTGGTVQQPGNLGAGVRQAVLFFKTRNNALTPCSNPVTFSLTEDANSIVCTNIAIGPPDTVARIIAFTPAAGAFFYWIPQPVTITSNGQKVTYTSTVVPDNSSTQATFTFTDAVLVESIEIDIQGNNLFEQIELGSCLGFIAYSSRVFAIGEQNKIQNLINLSFDGGYLPNPAGPLQPLGWTLDATFTGNGSLSVSPLFGNAYYILNATGSTISGATGMIEQTAFQDYLGTPIVEINTQYGVRVTASNPGGVNSAGNLVIDLFSPSLNRQYGSFTIPLSSMTSNMQIFTGNLLTAEFATAVPSDLLYRIYATGLPNDADVLIDRTEPFDLSQPVLSTQLRGSYFSNFEAFDDVTGVLGAAIQNQQPIRNAFTLFDNLYIVKSKSLYSTADNGITEPSGWSIREVSNKVGTPSIWGVDVGEGWAIIVGRAGCYIFDGGQPVKFSPEIDPLWEKIAWTYGYTIWVRNDTNNRRISIGVPLPTPNQWMPLFPSNPNPTEPNVVLVCSYKEVMSSGALASEAPVRQSYTGELKSFQLGRKWSVWSIEAAYADFIDRGDTSDPLFYCGDEGTAKIYQQITGTHTDDGAAILDQYVTFPFLKSSDAQQIQAGLHNLVTEFATALVEGAGALTVTVYPNTLDSPYAENLDPPFVLADPPPWGDTEMPCNVPGNRFFIGFQTQAVGDWFELSRVVLNVVMDPWAPVRGSNE
jgi:hypothetical protein